SPRTAPAVNPPKLVKSGTRNETVADCVALVRLVAVTRNVAVRPGLIGSSSVVVTRYANAGFEYTVVPGLAGVGIACVLPSGTSASTRNGATASSLAAKTTVRSPVPLPGTVPIGQRRMPSGSGATFSSAKTTLAPSGTRTASSVVGRGALPGFV